MELDDLVVEITATGRVSRDFEFCNQIRASAGGPAPHIAEGFGRFTAREFARYLRIALSSIDETQTHLDRGFRRRYFTAECYERASLLRSRAKKITTRLLASKLRQIEADERRRRAEREGRIRRREPDARSNSRT